MNKLIFSLLILICISCTQTYKHEKRKIGDEYVETTFINDTTYDGVMKVYTLTNILKSEMEYKSGIKNGYSKSFYPNGKLHDSMTYMNGLKQGYHIIYNQDGSLDYKDYFSNGRQVGNLFYYDKGRLYEYDFVSLDGLALYKVVYDEFGKAKEFGGMVITERAQGKIIDEEQQNLLFLYTINPPNISIKYSIGVFDSLTQNKSMFKEVPSADAGFVEMNLPPAKPKTSYYVMANYTDSASKFYKVYIEPLQF